LHKLFAKLQIKFVFCQQLPLIYIFLFLNFNFFFLFLISFSTFAANFQEKYKEIWQKN